jgi:chromosome segregation ATPase
MLRRTITELSARIDELSVELRAALEDLRHGVTQQNHRLSQIEQRSDAHSRRADGIQVGLDFHEERLGRIEVTLASLMSELEDAPAE